MGEHLKADEKSGELVIAGGRGERFGSRVSVCSSASSLMLEDDHDEAESSLVVTDPTTKSSPFTTQLAELQQDELSPLLANLSVRTGLSKHYQGKSRSFTHLSSEIELKDVPKKTTTYSTRMKACRGQASAGLGTNRSSNSCHLFGTHGKIIRKNKKMMMMRSSSVKGNQRETTSSI